MPVDLTNMSDDELALVVQSNGRYIPGKKTPTLNMSALSDDELSVIADNRPEADQLYLKYADLEDRYERIFAETDDPEKANIKLLSDPDVYHYARKHRPAPERGLTAAVWEGAKGMAKGLYDFGVESMSHGMAAIAAPFDKNLTFMDDALRPQADLLLAGFGGSMLEYNRLFEGTGGPGGVVDKLGSWMYGAVADRATREQMDEGYQERAREFALESAVMQKDLMEFHRVWGDWLDGKLDTVYKGADIFGTTDVDPSALEGATEAMDLENWISFGAASVFKRSAREAAELSLEVGARKLQLEMIQRAGAQAPKEALDEVPRLTRELAQAQGKLDARLAKVREATQSLESVSKPRELTGRALQATGRGIQNAGNAITTTADRLKAKVRSWVGDDGLTDAATNAANIVTHGKLGLVNRLTKGLIQDRGKDIENLGKVFVAGQQILPFWRAYKRLEDTTALGAAFATFADNIGLAEMTRLGYNTARGFVRGGAVGAGFGFGASGGDIDAAASGFGGSGVFGAAAGVGGSWKMYNNRAQFQKEYNGVHRAYMDALTDDQRADMQKIPEEGQKVIAYYSHVFPDVTVRVVNDEQSPGSAWYHPDRQEVVINTAARNFDHTEVIRANMVHEISHHMELHGMMSDINTLLMGDAELDIPGVYTARDAQGNPIVDTDELGNRSYRMNDEFVELKSIYEQKLRGVKRTNEDIVREIFAETAAAYLLDEDGMTFARDLKGGAIDAMIDRVGVFFDESAADSPKLLQGILGAIGTVFDVNGNPQTDTGVFSGRLKKDRRLQRLARRYVKTLAKSRHPGAIDKDAKTRSFTMADAMANPAILEHFAAGDELVYDEDGKIVYNPLTGDPEIRSSAEQKQRARARAEKLIEIASRTYDDPQVLQRRVTTDINGRTIETYTGRYLPEEVLKELEQNPVFNPVQMKHLRMLNDLMRESPDAVEISSYYQATTSKLAGGRTTNPGKALPGRHRIDFVYGMQLSKDGNLLLQGIALDTLNQNAQDLIKKGKATLWANSLPDLLKDTDTYLRNIASGRPGSEGIGDAKRDVIQNMTGVRYNGQMANINPWHETTVAPRTVHVSLRLDRINKMRPRRRSYTWGRSANEGMKRNFHPGWHGSPHTFDRFSTDKIGTGEGNQAFGWGLYFADSKEVAEHYRKVLTENRMPSHYDNKPLSYQESRVASRLLASDVGKEIEQTEASIRQRIQFLENGTALSTESMEDLQEQLGYLEKIKPEFSREKLQTGRLYQVDLKPSEDEYLLWDKPLSEQSEKVREAIRATGMDPLVDRGEWYYRALSTKEESKTRHGEGLGDGDKLASKKLRSLGIRGIKYLDGSSRGKGDGDYNYVIFDDADVEIQTRYRPDQIDTPEFREWFGDSKVVDAEGKPLVVYHGTDKDFSAFEERGGKVTVLWSTFDVKRRGFYFSPDERVARSFGSKIIPVYLSIQNPADLVSPDSTRVVFDQLEQQGLNRKWLSQTQDWEKFDDEDGELFVQALQRLGYDGVVIEEPLTDDMKELGVEYNSVSYIAFSPTQIKSATGNSGAFDPANPDIRYRPELLDHYSNIKGLTTVDPKYHGTGLRGAERVRKKDYPELYLNRSYFGRQGYDKEQGLGPNHYQAEVEMDELYDLLGDPLNLYAQADQMVRDSAGRYAPMDRQAKITMMEKLVRDAGYRGYYANEVVALFEAQEVWDAQQKRAVNYRPENEETSDQDLDGMDPWYLQAVNTEDTASIDFWFQRAAMAAMKGTRLQNAGMPERFYHGSAWSDHNVFGLDHAPNGQPETGYRNRRGFNKLGFWFTSDPGQGAAYGQVPTDQGLRDARRVYEVFLNIQNPLEFQSFQDFRDWLVKYGRQHGLDQAARERLAKLPPRDLELYIPQHLNAEQMRDRLRIGKKDGIIIWHSNVDGRIGVAKGDPDPTWAIVLDPGQIKSAAPVEYDDQGNVIPLSQRFNVGNPDIRFRPDVDAAWQAIHDPKNVDGFTIDFRTGEKVTSGYVVAPSKGTEWPINRRKITKNALRQYLDRYDGIENARLGGWYDAETDTFMLDVVRVVDNRDDAVYMARNGNQKAIFDLDNSDQINTDTAVKEMFANGTWDPRRADQLWPFTDVYSNPPVPKLEFTDHKRKQVIETSIGGRKYSIPYKDDKSRAQALGVLRTIRGSYHNPEALIIEPKLNADGSLKLTPVKKDGEIVDHKPEFQTVNYGFRETPLYRQATARIRKKRPGLSMKETKDAAYVEAMAERLVQEYRGWSANADIMAGQGWYSRMREKLVKAFGENTEVFAQLLGATSAQTAVQQNYQFAIDVFDRMLAGEFDFQVRKFQEGLALARAGELRAIMGANTDADALEAWIDQYDLKPRQKNGKLYGANSVAVLRVLSGVWLEMVQGPKTPNFAGNLTGRTLEATIDVWAARLTWRLSNLGHPGRWRVTPGAEQGVSEANFFLAQQAFRAAADQLGVNPDDLQAIAWFAEKHLWDLNGWTGLEGGKKSSFDEAHEWYFDEEGGRRSESETNTFIQQAENERQKQNAENAARRERLAAAAAAPA